MTTHLDEAHERERFSRIFSQLAAVSTYARRRGARDPDGIAAEVMAIAWQKLADVPLDDPLPWLLATARNLVLASRRATSRIVESDHEPAAEDPRLGEAAGLSAELADALAGLAPIDREALLLIAWEGLTPAQAAQVLGVRPVAFRVRLHRARRRCAALLDRHVSRSIVSAEVSHGS
ncbi:MAG TPA: sigma factor-like helix-turn-helix DNA-binding protein [Gaiellales bacterium]|jgi:RNA polymerase sigma-70 factor (ECF subfamily)